jgi:hypothetical protein
MEDEPMSVFAPKLTPADGRAVAAAALGLALALSTAPPADASSAITRSDLTGTTFLNPCTAEAITITDGTFQLIANTTIDSAGGLHVSVRGNAQGVVAQGASSADMYRLRVTSGVSRRSATRATHSPSPSSRSTTR